VLRLRAGAEEISLRRTSTIRGGIRGGRASWAGLWVWGLGLGVGAGGWGLGSGQSNRVGEDVKLCQVKETNIDL
jgi:hypothetical protein